MVAISDLPTTQFTAGFVAKLKGITIPEAHAELQKLVDKGSLTKKTAKSGAVNYKLAKGAANAKMAGTAPKASTGSKASASDDDGFQAYVDGTADYRQKVYDAAKAESAKLKAWKKNGSKGRRPSTPNLAILERDSVNRAAGVKPKRSRKSSNGDAGPRGTTVQFFVDDRQMPESQNKLSSVAYQATAGIDSEDSPRVSVSRLKEILADVGVKDPSNTEWVVELANGKTISTKKL